MLARVNGISAHSICRVARTHLEYHSRTPRVHEFQYYTMIRRMNLRMHIHLIRQGTRRSHPFFLLWNPNGHRIQSGDEVWDASPLELGNRGQKANGIVLRLNVTVIRVSKVKDGSQVIYDGTSPRRNIRLKHSETLFDELD